MTEAVTSPNSDQSDAGQHGNPPQSISDPTLMTIDALRREIAMLESLLNARLKAAEELTRERFHRVDQDLQHFEEQRREQKRDTQSAVDAALEAQKEATTKMERTVTDQIGSLKGNFDTSIRGIESALADLKDRMTVLESMKQGMQAHRTERREANSGQIAAIGVGIAILVAIVTVLGFAVGGG